MAFWNSLKALLACFFVVVLIGLMANPPFRPDGPPKKSTHVVDTPFGRLNVNDRPPVPKIFRPIENDRTVITEEPAPEMENTAVTVPVEENQDFEEESISDEEIVTEEAEETEDEPDDADMEEPEEPSEEEPEE